MRRSRTHEVFMDWNFRRPACPRATPHEGSQSSGVIRFAGRWHQRCLSLNVTSPGDSNETDLFHHQETIFALHWAAAQMPSQSPCFSHIDSDECQQELSYWLARVRNGDPRFISAYRHSQLRLGRPPLITRQREHL